MHPIILLAYLRTGHIQWPVWYRQSQINNFKAFLSNAEVSLFKSLVETVIERLKGTFGLISTKQRSISVYLSNIYASLCVYQLCQKNKLRIFIK